MLEKKEITKDDYENLCETIKDSMPDWLANMESYLNGDDDPGFYL